MTGYSFRHAVLGSILSEIQEFRRFKMTLKDCHKCVHVAVASMTPYWPDFRLHSHGSSSSFATIHLYITLSAWIA